jgi:hypothetical protein
MGFLDVTGDAATDVGISANAASLSGFLSMLFSAHSDLLFEVAGVKASSLKLVIHFWVRLTAVLRDRSRHLLGGLVLGEAAGGARHGRLRWI